MAFSPTTTIISGGVASGAYVDGSLVTIGAKTDAKSTATDATSISVMQVLKQISASVQAPPSQLVTNAGTFAVQSTNTNLELAQGAAIASKTGPMVQGSVSTAAPTYTTGTINPLSLTVAGALRVDGSGVTQPVSGTVTATGPLTDTQLRASAVPVSLASVPSHAVTNAGTFAVQATNANLDIAQGAAVASKTGPMLQGVATTGAPTYTTATVNPLSLDTAGNLRVNVVAGSTAGTQYTEDAVAAADPIGNAQIYVRLDTPAALVSADGDNVARRGNNFGGAYSTLIADNGTQAFVAQGTAIANIRGPLLQASVSTANPSYTTGQISPLSLTITGALRTDDESTVAQGSTTSGQLGQLGLAAVTTNNPTYTTAQSAALSLTTKGDLRVVTYQESGFNYCTAASAHTTGNPYYAIQCLKNGGETLSLAANNATGEAITAVTIPAGVTIYGDFTSVTPSGATGAYMLYRKTA